ncbi:hypothetical protein COLO4_05819 [Corchorus olitorius]|uniref:Uncharacterized protein n=1 Tax=Corchorus olitorius TaxID=93759 RepID=A0A1R3KPT2_9ROSI|nr:hypothetical protein COLO4_05819 [Corchorus olitorius]
MKIRGEDQCRGEEFRRMGREREVVVKERNKLRWQRSELARDLPR